MSLPENSEIMSSKKVMSPSGEDSESDSSERTLRSNVNKDPARDYEELKTAVMKITNSVMAIQNKQVEINQNVDLLLRAHSGKFFDNPISPLTEEGQSFLNYVKASTSQFIPPPANTNQINSNIPKIVVENPTSHTYSPLVSLDRSFPLPIPEYNPQVMTPEHFLQEAEEYFLIRNIAVGSWLMLIFRMFPSESDVSRWWRETRHTVKDWQEFKSAFLAYETSGQSKDILLHTLFQKKQKVDEAFETFAWDINSIFNRIEANVEIEEVISRILNACLPEVSVYLRQHKFKSVAELNAKAREVINDLTKIRKFEGKSLFRARQTDPYVKVESNKPKFQSTWFKSKPNSTTNDPKQQATTNETRESITIKNNEETEKLKSHKQCKYCQKMGHTIDECRKKKWVDEKKKSEPKPDPQSKN